MSKNGLSRWQILQLVRNGFQAALCSLEERRVLVRAAERNIVEILTNTQGED
jgi:cob(I)alamin adenosyltransferase